MSVSLSVPQVFSIQCGDQGNGSIIHCVSYIPPFGRDFLKICESFDNNRKQEKARKGVKADIEMY